MNESDYQRSRWTSSGHPPEPARRQELSHRLDQSAGAGQGAYDASGNLVVEDIGDVHKTWDIDLVGYARGLTTVLGTAGQLAYTRIGNTMGQTRFEQQILSNQEYSYDSRSRLIKVQEHRLVDREGTPVAPCWTREYALSLDSNRLGLTEYDPAANDACQSSTAAKTTTRQFDSADRAVAPGYSYDALGRTLSVPSQDTQGANEVSVGYHSNDLVRSVTEQDLSQTYDLDPATRVQRITTSSGGVETAQIVNHYADGSDSPAWSTSKTRAEASSAWDERWSRYVTGLSGELELTVDEDAVQVMVPNLDGDVVATWNLNGAAAGTVTGFSEAHEFGAATPYAVGRFGWLGGHMRDGSTALGGLTLMGVRLYNPATGRFLSRDPIDGGNDNSYIYPADPVNMLDLDGRWGYSFTYTIGKFAGTAASFFSRVKARFTSVFPFPGRRPLRLGAKMNLRPHHIGWFPVKVTKLTKTGWTFGTRLGHPDHPGGNIKFKFSKKGGKVRMRVEAHIPWNSAGGVCWLSPGCKATYLGAAYRDWRSFARNLRRLL